MADSRKKAETPHLALTFTEAARACVEGAASVLVGALVQRVSAKGDGSPVLFLPGFMTGDAATAMLRRAVERAGYKAYGWGEGVNTGLDGETFENLRRRLEEISRENAGRKVAVVGHSLGGIYARELARAFPDLVSKIVTLGSPFSAGAGEGDATPLVRAVFDFFHAGHAILKDEELQKSIVEPPRQPTTSIYSAGDGIVHWKSCLNPDRPLAENIGVLGSHLGMTVNPLIQLIVLDRLAEPVEHWKPFDPGKYPCLSRMLRRTLPAAPGLQVERGLH